MLKVSEVSTREFNDTKRHGDSIYTITLVTHKVRSFNAALVVGVGFWNGTEYHGESFNTIEPVIHMVQESPCSLWLLALGFELYGLPSIYYLISNGHILLKSSSVID